MTEHDFTDLFERYPEIIADMPATFKSHEFILKLAQLYQVLYVDALHAYSHLPDNPNPAPFQIVHGILAKHLTTVPQLVTYIGEVNSTAIFTQENRCAQWQKVREE